MLSTHSEALYMPLIDIVYRLSFIGYRLSVNVYRLSFLRLKFIVYRLSVIVFCGYRSSFIGTVVGLGMRATVMSFTHCIFLHFILN